MNQAKLQALLRYDAQTGHFWWVGGRRSGRRAGFGEARGRIQICIDGKNYYAHRLAWLYVYGVEPDGVIDHANGLPLDNRIENLRLTTQSGNLENQRHARSDNKSSGLLGVSKKRGRWRAAIRVAGKSCHIGTYDSKEEAHEAYVAAKRKLHPMGTI